MKKKILFVLAIAFVLCCIFVISASAQVTIYDDAPVRVNYQALNEDIVVFDDGFSCPTSYVFKDKSTVANGSWGNPTIAGCFDFTYINEKTGKTYEFANIVELDLPQGITSIGTYFAHRVTTIKKVSFPNTLTSLGGSTFEACTSIEECVFEHDENSGLTSLPNYIFSGATSLKAFSMPDCVTTLTGEGNHFANSTSLGAVYLSKNLTTIVGSRTDRAVFDGCRKLYFVNEPFSYDNIPEKQAVYYFPSQLGNLPKQCMFRYCSSLNEVLVFGENMLSLDHMYALQGTGTKSVVFLGAVESISISNWTNISVYLVNDSADIANVDSDVERANYTVAVKMVYLCKKDKAYLPVKVDGATTVNLVEQDGSVTHLAEKIMNVPASCGVDAGVATYCYCGYEISKNAVPGTALVHDYDYINNAEAKLVSVVYSNYAQQGIKTVTCANCKKDGQEKAAPLFDSLGYSAPEDEDRGGIVIGYMINYDAIAEYEKATGKAVSFGVYAIAQEKLGENDIFDENGNLAEGAISAEVTKNAYVSFEFKIVGFDDDTKDKLLAIGAYVALTKDKVTEYSYLQLGTPAEGAKYAFTSYTEYLASLL